MRLRLSRPRKQCACPNLLQGRQHADIMHQGLATETLQACSAEPLPQQDVAEEAVDILADPGAHTTQVRKGCEMRHQLRKTQLQPFSHYNGHCVNHTAMQVEIHISCKDMKNADGLLGKSDPFAVVYESVAERWIERGRTEIIVNQLSTQPTTALSSISSLGPSLGIAQCCVHTI